MLQGDAPWSIKLDQVHRRVRLGGEAARSEGLHMRICVIQTASATSLHMLTQYAAHNTTNVLRCTDVPSQRTESLRLASHLQSSAVLSGGEQCSAVVSSGALVMIQAHSKLRQVQIHSQLDMCLHGR